MVDRSKGKVRADVAHEKPWRWATPRLMHYLTRDRDAHRIGIARALWIANTNRALGRGGGFLFACSSRSAPTSALQGASMVPSRLKDALPGTATP
jgi:hypothetical protein